MNSSWKRALEPLYSLSFIYTENIFSFAIPKRSEQFILILLLESFNSYPDLRDKPT